MSRQVFLHLHAAGVTVTASLHLYPDETAQQLQQKLILKAALSKCEDVLTVSVQTHKSAAEASAVFLPLSAGEQQDYNHSPKNMNNSKRARKGSAETKATASNPVKVGNLGPFLTVRKHFPFYPHLLRLPRSGVVPTHRGKSCPCTVICRTGASYSRSPAWSDAKI